MMQLITESYAQQIQRWPRSGRHILAQYDADSVVVYQAYRPAIGNYAAQHGFFGGEFSFTRMSWIKPNFLWMMYRSGWGTKEGQELTLAVRLRRTAFDTILSQAVPSSFDAAAYVDQAAWQHAVAGSDVRLQWDPDHDPSGQRMERRAIQLGMRGAVLRAYARDWVVEIDDISALVAQQRRHALAGAPYEHLITPREDVYPLILRHAGDSDCRNNNESAKSYEGLILCLTFA